MPCPFIPMHYNYDQLAKSLPEFKQFIQKNGNINYADPDAVIALNRALLKQQFDISVCIPRGHLCPTIPNRVEYLKVVESFLAKFLSTSNSDLVTLVDIGTGVCAVYPLVGCARNANWKFLATDVDDEILRFAAENIEKNPRLSDRITLIKNPNPARLFPQELTDRLPHDLGFVICNPPFYSSEDEIVECRSAKRHRPLAENTEMSFSEKVFEQGGEFGFIKRMVDEVSEAAEHFAGIEIYSSMLGSKSSLTSLLAYISTKTDVSFGYELLKMSHTTRWLLFWSFKHKLPTDSRHRLRFTAKMNSSQEIDVNEDFDANKFTTNLLSTYGELSQTSCGLYHLKLTQNRWSRKARRGEVQDLTENLLIEVTLHPRFIEFILTNQKDSGSWDAFVGFINHLRKQISS